MTHTAYIEAWCGIFGNQTLKVEFDYTPEDDGGDEYPSSPESYDIQSVYIVAVEGKFWPFVRIEAEVAEVLIDVTKLNNIDDQAIIDLIRETE